MPHMIKALFLSTLLLLSSLAQAEVKITDAWARATAPGQDIAAAYMNLNSASASALFYVESDSAESVEIHSMSMDNGVMKMRMLDQLELQPNKTEKLAPGGFHLMLFGLKAPLQEGQQVTFTLCFKDKAGKITHQKISVPVKTPK
jgi:periplasmic copper chaperone A